VALKTGFLTKFLKPILIGIGAVILAVGKAFKSIFGRFSGASERDRPGKDPQSTEW
jgi:hypothetical protein